jgi:hypothetical protein
MLGDEVHERAVEGEDGRKSAIAKNSRVFGNRV